MADNRAQKSGFARDQQNKVNAKWDGDIAKQAVTWVGQRIGVDLSSYDGSMDQCHELFSNGQYLGMLANWVKPGSIGANKLSRAQTLPFKKMELIEMFLNSINEAKGGMVKESQLCATVDLYEKVNLVQFITTLEALGRAMVTAGREGFGKAESEKNVRNFSEDQLKAGQNVIGLQMGSNKGASQAGQNFGKSRMIVD